MHSRASKISEKLLDCRRRSTTGEKSVQSRCSSRAIESMTREAGSTDMVLDFFAGSGSTAHAVLDRNLRRWPAAADASAINLREPLASEDSAAQPPDYETVATSQSRESQKVMGMVEGFEEDGLRVVFDWQRATSVSTRGRRAA